MGLSKSPEKLEIFVQTFQIPLPKIVYTFHT